MGERVPTLGGEEGIPTLDGGRGTYLGWRSGTYIGCGEGVPTLDRGRGYLPWTGCAAGGTPLVACCRRTFLFEKTIGISPLKSALILKITLLNLTLLKNLEIL